MVATEQGFLKGDATIFERLIAKVEEINNSTRSGESVLKLYDPEAEERYIAEAGLLAGNTNLLEQSAINADDEAAALETILKQANPAQHDDFLKFLLGDPEQPTASASVPPAAAPVRQSETASRLRFYPDKKFLLEGYRYLAEQNQSYQPIEASGNLLMLTAPKDLRRRLGAQDDRSDVIFGATAIPAEAWPENNQFRLTDDPEQVNLAIKAARNTSGYWSKELLCTDQHPILQWVTERILMQLPRGQCPLIFSRKLEAGELCFCFIGQVISRGGAPLAVDAHAISFRKGGGFAHRPLHEALDAAGFAQLVNEGATANLSAVQLLIPAAVEVSLTHLRALRDQRIDEQLPLLRAEERRLRLWKTKRTELLEDRIEQLGPQHPKSTHYRKALEEMKAYLRDREKNWRDTYFEVDAEPNTQLVLVIEGKN